jgi:alpha-D-xyloside xylohydrolase
VAFEEREYEITIRGHVVEAAYHGERVRLSVPSPGVIRVQATRNAAFADRPWALAPQWSAGEGHGDAAAATAAGAHAGGAEYADAVPTLPAEIRREDGRDGDAATVTTAALTAELSPRGVLRFLDAESGAVLLEEPAPRLPFETTGRSYAPKGSEIWRIEQRFLPRDERIYGMGQHQDGIFDRKGSEVDLFQRNTEVAIPFYYSSAGYGFLWNNPAVGRAGFARNGTRWVAEAARELDYCVIAAESPAEALRRYAELTGKPPEMPAYAAGFWQSKLRYETQEEAVEILREYRRRKLPLSVLVIDFFHWPHMGDWRFDERYWPDPAEMLQEARGGDAGDDSDRVDAAAGEGASALDDTARTEVMVSVWPTVNPDGENFPEMHRRGLLAQTEYGAASMMEFIDADADGTTALYYYDPFNPAAREFLWSTVKRNYYDLGVRIFWLDACEPEAYPYDPHNVRYYAGRGDEVGCAYPFMHQRGFYEGMRSAGLSAPLNLCRSAWAGSQRYGAAVWSGDIRADFEALRTQVVAGLSMAMSGIPWWTTDIGGFFANPTDTPEFRELLIRWFQYGAFCPIFRLHGFRDSDDFRHGGPNEIWSFGDAVYRVAARLLRLREAMKPYILAQMREAARSGIPPMRPLFVDFPADARAYELWDQYMFGPDLMVAPVLHREQRSRRVYMPIGGSEHVLFRDPRSERTLRPGETVEVDAALEEIPLFVREGSDVATVIASFMSSGRTKD